MIKLSVIVPVYNEEESLPELVDRLKPVCESIGSYEVFFVDDGSTDKSFSVMSKFAEDWTELKLIKFKKRSGKTCALHAGISEAKGELVATIDADLQESPAEIPKLIAAIQGYDAVFGWRNQRNDSFLKHFASRSANAIRRFFLHDHSRDSACSLKVFRRSILIQLPLCKGLHRFFPSLMDMYGFSYREIKIQHWPRKYGKSKYGVFARAFPGMMDMMALIWMRKRKLDYQLEKKLEAVNDDIR